MESEEEEIGNDYGGPRDCLPGSQQGQGPKASCVRSSPLWVRTQEKARRERRPRTAGLEVGNLEVVGPEHGWERGAGSCPGPATRWRPRAGNGGPGGKGSSRAQEESHLDLGARYSTPALFHSPWPPRTQVPPSATTPTSPSTRPRKVGPPQKATFKLRQTCLSPPPP